VSKGSASVTFQPDGDAEVTVNGADLVDGDWTVYSGQIYQTAIALPLTGYGEQITQATRARILNVVNGYYDKTHEEWISENYAGIDLFPWLPGASARSTVEVRAEPFVLPHRWWGDVRIRTCRAGGKRRAPLVSRAGDRP
jgi:hypothetical protein